MPTIGETSEKASANADHSVKSRTGVLDRSTAASGAGAASVMGSLPSLVRASGARASDPVGVRGQNRLWARPRGQTQGAAVLGDRADCRDPQAGEGLHPLDQLLQRLGACRPAGHERVTTQDERGAEALE